MIINKLAIRGFKCFSNEKFEVKDITVLTGNNGTGKSSLIQALLLIRSAIEKNLKESITSDYEGKMWKSFPTALNLGYGLALGTVSDIFNENSLDGGKIKIELDTDTFEIDLPSTEEESYSVNISLANSDVNKDCLPFWRKKEFYYLQTERLGPRFELASNFTDYINCGYKGEYTAQVLLKNPFFKVSEKRLIITQKSEFLPQQVDSWLGYVSPGTTVKSVPLGTLSSQIRLGNNFSNKDVLSTNYGFGISYSLPIIVTGLIAEEGSVFIVENPEAHLHPKGQSNIGFFLGRIAASGVKVIIETHSEHVINGIRRAVVTSEDLNAKDISIYFFNNFDKRKARITRIDIEPNGDLSDFPVDFFDQVRQDLMEILKSSKR